MASVVHSVFLHPPSTFHARRFPNPPPPPACLAPASRASGGTRVARAAAACSADSTPGTDGSRDSQGSPAEGSPAQHAGSVPRGRRPPARQATPCSSPPARQPSSPTLTPTPKQCRGAVRRRDALLLSTATTLMLFQQALGTSAAEAAAAAAAAPPASAGGAVAAAVCDASLAPAVTPDLDFGLPPKLTNKYFLLRHGRSKANEAGLVVSALENGIKPEFALAVVGEEQAREAGRQLQQILFESEAPAASVVVFASPFSRTRQTAALATAGVESSLLLQDGIEIETNLRERYFGTSMELQDHKKYPAVWMGDMADPRVGPEGGGESVVDVARRVAAVIRNVEASMQGKNVLLVSHGDTLQIVNALLFGSGLLSPSAYDPPQEFKQQTLPLIAAAQQCGWAPPLEAVLSRHRAFAFQTGELRPLPTVW